MTAAWRLLPLLGAALLCQAVPAPAFAQRQRETREVIRFATVPEATLQQEGCGLATRRLVELLNRALDLGAQLSRSGQRWTIGGTVDPRRLADWNDLPKACEELGLAPLSADGKVALEAIAAFLNSSIVEVKVDANKTASLYFRAPPSAATEPAPARAGSQQQAVSTPVEVPATPAAPPTETVPQATETAPPPSPHAGAGQPAAPAERQVITAESFEIALERAAPRLAAIVSDMVLKRIQDIPPQPPAGFRNQPLPQRGAPTATAPRPLEERSPPTDVASLVRDVKRDTTQLLARVDTAPLQSTIEGLSGGIQRLETTIYGHVKSHSPDLLGIALAATGVLTGALGAAVLGALRRSGASDRAAQVARDRATAAMTRELVEVVRAELRTASAWQQEAAEAARHPQREDRGGPPTARESRRLPPPPRPINEGEVSRSYNALIASRSPDAIADDEFIDRYAARWALPSLPGAPRLNLVEAAPGSGESAFLVVEDGNDRALIYPGPSFRREWHSYAGTPVQSSIFGGLFHPRTGTSRFSLVTAAHGHVEGRSVRVEAPGIVEI